MKGNRIKKNVNFDIPDKIKEIMLILEKNGYKAYMIGGSVRDLLVGKEPADFDIATNAKPDSIEAVFSNFKTLDIGKKHGTITVFIDKESVEITTFRKESDYSDKRRPDQVIFTDTLKEDVKRRDFKMNTIAVDIYGNIIDYEKGIQDLKNKIISCVGDPIKRFDEDGLRIIRAIRFEAQLGYPLEIKTEKAVHERKENLKFIAAERIRDEFSKILISEGAVNVLRKYRDVIAVFIPEIAETFDFDQKNPYHCYDVYEHILHAINNTPKDEEIRLAVFLHDIGKPRCFVIKKGWGHFYGHEKISSEIAEDIMKRLKYPAKTIEEVKNAIKVHGTVFELNEKYARKKINKLGEDVLKLLINMEKADVLAQDPTVREERAENIDMFSEIVNKVILEKQCFRQKDMKINGEDLIKEGFVQGKFLGDTKKFLLGKIISGEIENNREILIKEARKILEAKNIK